MMSCLRSQARTMSANKALSSPEGSENAISSYVTDRVQQVFSLIVGTKAMSSAQTNARTEQPESKPPSEAPEEEAGSARTLSRATDGAVPVEPGSSDEL
uniref:Uncharacterized protein n=1 Tax=Trichuris muris TaxID=70415 RepID=A0A5S6QSA3_TRIMR